MPSLTKIAQTIKWFPHSNVHRNLMKIDINPFKEWHVTASICNLVAPSQNLCLWLHMFQFLSQIVFPTAINIEEVQCSWWQMGSICSDKDQPSAVCTFLGQISVKKKTLFSSFLIAYFLPSMPAGHSIVSLVHAEKVFLRNCSFFLFRIGGRVWNLDIFL